MELYHVAKLPKQKREHHILERIISDYYPSLFKHGRGRGLQKGKKKEKVCSNIYNSIGTALSCLSGFQYSPGLSKIRFLTLHEKSQFPSSYTSLSQGNGTKLFFLPGKSWAQI